MKLTRRYRFSSSHRLNSPRLGAEENQRVYGKCNNPYGHGHDYVLEVSVSGKFDHATGRVVDLEQLDSVVSREVVEPFDHRNMNVEIAAFADMVPTTENVAVEIGRRLREAWSAPESRIEKIRIWETPRNIFELSL